MSAADPLSRAAIEAVDPAGMLADVLAQPAQLGDAVWRAESAAFQRADLPRGLVVAGMGGSAVGGDLAAAVLAGRATRPVHTIRGYELEPWVGPETLVLCASYSGDTEETLACFEAAGAAGAPRAAVVYMTVAALEAAAACGAAPSIRDEVEGAAALLGGLGEEWGPDAAPDSDAKRLAVALRGTVPVITGAGPTAAVARRWKTQINENASAPAFAAELPEADHNEVCGYAPPLAAVFLDDAQLDDRVRRRIELTADLIAPAVAALERVEARGNTPFERAMSLVLLGDLVSVYLAVLAGEDPTPVPSIDRLKERLG